MSFFALGTTARMSIVEGGKFDVLAENSVTQQHTLQL